MRPPLRPAALRTPRDVGVYLRMLRHRRGLALAEAAALSGVNPATISGWENHHSSPGAVGLLRLLAAYGVVLAAHPDPASRWHA